MKKYTYFALWLFFGTTSAKVIGFFVNIYIARVLTPASYGFIIIGASLVTYATQFSNAGLRQLGLIETAKPENNKDFSSGEIFFLRIVQGVLVFVLFFTISFFLYRDSTIRLIILLYLLNILFESIFLDWYFRAKHHFKLVSITRTTVTLLYALTVTIYVNSPTDAWKIPLIFFITNMMAAGILIYNLRFTPFKAIFILPIKRYFKILIEAMYLGISEILSQAHIYLPPIIIGKILTSDNSSYFGVAFKIVSTASIIDAVFVNIFLSSFPRMWMQNRENAKKNFQTLLNLTLGLGMLIALILTLSAKPLILLLFGTDYSTSIYLLQIMAWYTIATLLNSNFSYFYITTGNRQKYLQKNIVAALISSTFLIVLIAKFHLTGAAIALVIGEIIFAIVFYVECYKKNSIHFLARFLKTICTVIVSLLIFNYLPITNDIIRTLLAVLSYCILIIPLGIISTSDINYMVGKWKQS